MKGKDEDAPEVEEDKKTDDQPLKTNRNLYDWLVTSQTLI